MVNIVYSFKSQGTESLEFFAQGIENCQNLRYESLVIVDRKYEEIFSLTVLNVKTVTKRNRYFLT